uniref:Uncharacterized protein n=1 Tax=Anguilla anguilla TaxID=7936 RepID=A0A0E9TQL4_ANGAN
MHNSCSIQPWRSKCQTIHLVQAEQ